MLLRANLGCRFTYMILDFLLDVEIIFARDLRTKLWHIRNLARLTATRHKVLMRLLLLLLLLYESLRDWRVELKLLVHLSDNIQ